MEPIQITYDDGIGMAIGTAAEAVFTWTMRRKTATPGESPIYPSLPSTLFLATPALCMAAVGMQRPETGMNRWIASILLGFGISTVVSYAIPVITGGEQIDLQGSRHY